MPRPLPTSHGLRGPGQTVFPEDAKEQARRIGLKEEAVLVLKHEQVEDAGGDWSTKYVPQPPAIRGRIDPVGGGARNEMFAEGIVESTSHIVTMDPDAAVEHHDRLEVEGQTWEITADEVVSDPSSKMVQVKESA